MHNESFYERTDDTRIKVARLEVEVEKLRLERNFLGIASLIALVIICDLLLGLIG